MSDSKPVEPVADDAEAAVETGGAVASDVAAAVIEPVALVVDESVADSTRILNQRMEDRHKELMDCLARVEEKVDSAMAALETATVPQDVPASVAAAEAVETPVIVAEPDNVTDPKPEKPRRGFSNLLRHK